MGSGGLAHLDRGCPTCRGVRQVGDTSSADSHKFRHRLPEHSSWIRHPWRLCVPSGSSTRNAKFRLKKLGQDLSKELGVFEGKPALSVG